MYLQTNSEGMHRGQGWERLTVEKKIIDIPVTSKQVYRDDGGSQTTDGSSQLRENFTNAASTSQQV